MIFLKMVKFLKAKWTKFIKKPLKPLKPLNVNRDHQVYFDGGYRSYADVAVDAPAAGTTGGTRPNPHTPDVTLAASAAQAPKADVKLVDPVAKARAPRVPEAPSVVLSQGLARDPGESAKPSVIISAPAAGGGGAPAPPRR